MAAITSHKDFKVVSVSYDKIEFNMCVPIIYLTRWEREKMLDKPWI